MSLPDMPESTCFFEPLAFVTISDLNGGTTIGQIGQDPSLIIVLPALHPLELAVVQGEQCLSPAAWMTPETYLQLDGQIMTELQDFLTSVQHSRPLPLHLAQLIYHAQLYCPTTRQLNAPSPDALESGFLTSRAHTEALSTTLTQLTALCEL